MSERKSRKTFATATLRKINSRIQYYRRVLNNPNTNIEQLERIRKKYEKDLRIRKLLNRAINNLNWISKCVQMVNFDLNCNFEFKK